MTDTNNILQKLRVAGWTMVALLLLLPAAAMGLQADGVDWSAQDFIIASLLLIGTGLAIEALVRISDNTAYRFGAALGVLTTLFMVWSNLAVGIVGSESDPFNSFYFLLLPLIGLGALVVRLRAGGMAKVMGLAAAFPVGMGMIALMLGKHLQPMDSIAEVVVVNGMFALLYAASAMFFARAARKRGA